MLSLCIIVKARDLNPDQEKMDDFPEASVLLGRGFCIIRTEISQVSRM